jgi:hypothetical protein
LLLVPLVVFKGLSPVSLIWPGEGYQPLSFVGKTWGKKRGRAKIGDERARKRKEEES